MMPCLTAFSTMGCLHFLHFPLPVKACSTLGDSLLFSVLILVYILYFKKACLASEFDTAKKEGEREKIAINSSQQSKSLSQSKTSCHSQHENVMKCHLNPFQSSSSPSPSSFLHLQYQRRRQSVLKKSTNHLIFHPPI